MTELMPAINVETAGVCRRDGLLITIVGQAEDERSLSESAAGLFNASAAALEDAGCGMITRLDVETTAGRLVGLPIGKQLFMFVVTRAPLAPDAENTMREYSKKLAVILGQGIDKIRDRLPA